MRAWVALMICGMAIEARADTCSKGKLTDPIAIGLREGDLSTPRRACTRSEVSLLGGGSLIADTDDFYGNVRLAGVVSGAWALSEDSELFLALEVVRFQTVISSLSASTFGLGHTSVGAAQRIVHGRSWLITGATRLVLPTALGIYENSWPFGLDVGVSASNTFSDSLEVHGWFGWTGSIAATRGPNQPRVGALLDAGITWTPASWFGLVLDVEGSAFYREVLDHVAGGIGLRAAVSDALAFSLDAKVPLAGDERALAGAIFGVTLTP